MSTERLHTEIAKLFSLISQIGLMIVISILGCTFLGKFLDSKLNTTPVL
ncbi:AtpZ/AtpI family protein, partial [Clostridioides difficile]